VFWETGAIADQVTDHRHYVFRPVATGSMLGQQIAAFTSTVLLLRDHLQPVSAGARAEAHREGISHLITVAYNHYTVARRLRSGEAGEGGTSRLRLGNQLSDRQHINPASARRPPGPPSERWWGKCSAFVMAERGQRLGGQAAGSFCGR
jgi:hypothetical protein